jgi:hypothetical protein
MWGLSVSAVESEEKELMLWGGVELDCTVQQLEKKRCAVCGKPAAVAVRELERQERVFLCGGCREPK